ncbi:MAG TPA: hypothetical protein VMU89_04315 [Thermomicrobiaceae bacterium]|nr:hypothetical protein [Thermomicrobiaceae bacterium]
MEDKRVNDGGVHYCEACGRVVPASGARQVATRTLCLQCALAWKLNKRGDWPPPGYVWDGTRWRFDVAGTTTRSYVGYQPTDRELQWWCFLSWLAATGRVKVGADEGAETSPAAG